ncbi:YaiI/YqxD family protein [bacterium]|nr:YaiI/YqxD family protein [bacterium]
MILYIDGDAFPNVLKPILLRAIERFKLKTFAISNQSISIGKSKYITYTIVSAGADEADHRIVEMVAEGDLVITADIPLADRVITKNAHAIDHRGGLFSADNIKQSLAIRNLMQEIRDTGEITKGPTPFSQKDAHKFANKLDQFLTKQKMNHERTTSE